MKLKLLFINLLLFICTININGATNFPANDWPNSSMEKDGFGIKKINDLFTVVKEENQVKSILIISNGNIVAEYLKSGTTKDTVFNFFSCTKSFTSALIGIAIDLGYIKSENQLLSDYFPEIKKTPGKNQITLHHLLSMTSGLDWPESTEWGHFFSPMIRSSNWVNFIVNRDMECQPGHNFNYNSGESHLLSAIIQKSTAKNTLDFANEHLFTKLGMNSVTWPTDPQGINFGGAWIQMTTRDAARFAYFYLNKGIWNGEQIISESWIDKSTKVQSAGYKWDDYTGGNYGYQWWINTYRGYKTYYAWGAREQYIFITPELNLIAIFTSSFNNGNYKRPPYLYSEYIITSFE